jgi:hypothetical protein
MCNSWEPRWRRTCTTTNDQEQKEHEQQLIVLTTIKNQEQKEHEQQHEYRLQTKVKRSKNKKNMSDNYEHEHHE